MKRRILFVWIATLCSAAMAEEPTDSMYLPSDNTPICRYAPSTISPTWQPTDRWKDLRQSAYISVPLIVGGLLVKSEDTHFRRLRNDYLPTFKRHVDDYMQFAPAAVMIGLKTAGMKSRSSWGRMLAADVFSIALMTGVVNTLKTSTQVERPDGSNRHSFPSGHTATAFMTATMLTKEYGQKSPWIGIGAYTAASATGLMRMANNKHWLSDVMTGAGIGILSTEIGYLLTDMIFKERGLHSVQQVEHFDKYDRPSFLGLYLGMNVPLSGYDISEQTEMSTSSGTVAGVEGAYFLNPYVGLGGRFTASSTYIILNKTEAADHTLDAVTMAAGAYFSYPLSARWLVGTKALAQYVHYPRLKLPTQTVAARHGLGIGSGVSLTFKARNHYSLRLFLDYNLLPSHSRLSGEWMNTLVTGMSFNL